MCSIYFGVIQGLSTEKLTPFFGRGVWTTEREVGCSLVIAEWRDSHDSSWMGAA